MFEVARTPEFSSLPLILEDWIKDNGGTYSGEFAFDEERDRKIEVFCLRTLHCVVLPNDLLAGF